jgi:hypothetical protein
VAADETVKTTSEHLTNSFHVNNRVHNQTGEANLRQPLVPSAVFCDKNMFWFRELSSPCGTLGLLDDKDTCWSRELTLPWGTLVFVEN